MHHINQESTSLQIDLHTALEEKLPYWFLKRVDKPSITIYPNKCKVCLATNAIPTLVAHELLIKFYKLTFFKEYKRHLSEY